MSDGFPEITDLPKNGPAAKCDQLKPGDRITQLTDATESRTRSLQGLSQWKTRHLFRGPIGSKVELHVIAGATNEQKRIELTRTSMDSYQEGKPGGATITLPGSGTKKFYSENQIEHFVKSSRVYPFLNNPAEISAYPEQFNQLAVGIVTKLSAPEFNGDGFVCRGTTLPYDFVLVAERSQSLFADIVRNNPQARDFVIIHCLIGLNEEGKAFGELQEIMFLNPEKPDVDKPLLSTVSSSRAIQSVPHDMSNAQKQTVVKTSSGDFEEGYWQELIANARRMGFVRTGDDDKKWAGAFRAMRLVFAEAGIEQPSARMICHGLDAMTSGGLYSMSPENVEKSILATRMTARLGGIPVATKAQLEQLEHSSRLK